MGLRFQRSVRLFPGVRLNFSRSGISTTIGVRGAGVTVGPHGTYANIGLPGTGLSYRTKLSPSPEHGSSFVPSVAPPSHPNPTPIPVPGTALAEPIGEEIHSGAVSGMTSAGLGELKKPINEAAVRKTTLVRTVSANDEELQRRERKLRFAKKFIIWLFTQRSVPRLQAEVKEAQDNLSQSRAELEACVIDIDFGLDDVAAGTWAALCRSFSNLCSSEKIWDITASAQTDRIKERTTATQRVTRSPVRFDLSQIDIIHSEYKGACLRNASSFELNLLPGFVLTREIGSDFALVEWKHFVAQFSPSRFIETDPIPSDSEVVGYTWAKANKDGSPDRPAKRVFSSVDLRYWAQEFPLSAKSGHFRKLHLDLPL